ncbi:sulfotransferase [Acuticoccus sediminis]|uniref:Sulfotransferase n=1 Tax=Acuticoccus sediminis TaxID=2184697 RepID=A0A8B2NNX5_9HYPH|nr:sulfotransferase domain-containing protein [Acuticoccus sediminis]RAH98389.1 sulfotransferase [Acuticoccus sediminis]
MDTTRDGRLRRYGELDGKTFLIGVGAAKCATSWLWAYLATLDGVVVSPLKELHFFNAKVRRHAIEDMDTTAIRRLAFHIVQEGDACARLRTEPLFQASVDRVAMMYDDNAYFGHFARLCTGAPDARVVCDITPSYSLMGREGFGAMRAFCASQDVAVKLVYVMRDPVDRLWSHVRYYNHLDSRRNAETSWRDLLDDPRFMGRSDYADAVEALDATFAPGCVHYVFYEDLFTDAALADLCAFLDVEARPTDMSARRNETEIRTPIPDEARALIAERLAPQYDFCRRRFAGRVPERWAL